MAFGDSDLATFFGATGVDVQFGEQDTRGNLDEVGVTDQLVGLIVEDQTHTLEIGRGSLDPMPKSGQRLEADGRPFTVRSVNPVDDGAIVRLALRKGWKT